MDAGKLNRCIAIQTSSAIRDSYGAETLAWTAFATAWARITPTGGSERYINRQIVAEATHEIAIRYVAGVTPKMRVLYGSRVFDILQVHNLDEKNVELRLICRELV